MPDILTQKHFILLTFSAQGHTTPGLEFAKRLVRAGAQVTFLTAASVQKRMLKTTDFYPDGLSFVSYSDGYDDGINANDDVDHYFTEFRSRASEALSSLIQTCEKEGRQITCLIYTLLIPWAAEMAQKFHLPSFLLWIQPATVFDIYYYFFCGYKELILDNINDSSYCVQLPGLPPLKSRDIPSFFLPSNVYAFGIELFQQQFEIFSRKATPVQVLVNTFDDLEPGALKAIDRFYMIPVGPLVPSVFLDGKDHSGKSSGGDSIKWLDSKEKSSVVYVSFGSFAVVKSKQMEELARALVESGRPFLWVIRSGEQAVDENFGEILSGEHKGMIVSWCSQVDVLNHPSIGCFVTHCGWNSTLETLAMGVPVVAFPLWSDQETNAKLIQDVWKIGVRVRPNEENKIVTSEEVRRCLDQVMEGVTSEELRSNSKKWEKLAREAGKQGGSSDKNLRAFVEGVGQLH